MTSDHDERQVAIEVPERKTKGLVAGRVEEWCKCKGGRQFDSAEQGDSPMAALPPLVMGG